MHNLYAINQQRWFRTTKIIGVFLLVLINVSLLTFGLYYLAPGDKAMAIARARYVDESGVSITVINQITTEFQLDQSFFWQYTHWLEQSLRGDFGHSLVSGDAVFGIFLGNIDDTLLLAVAALGIGLSMAFIFSVISVYNQGSLIDRLVIGLSSVGAALPSYWLGLILILIFAATLNYLPAYGSGTWQHLILPSFTLSVWVCASQTRLLRSFFLKAKSEPFIEILKLRGVGEVEIFTRHILRHSLLPALTMIALDFASLLEGAVIIEVIFSRSGIGSLLVSSVMSRDYPVILFLVMFSAACYLSINIVLELAQQHLDPRRKSFSSVRGH